MELARHFPRRATKKEKFKRQAIKTLRDGNESYGLWTLAYMAFDRLTGFDTKAEGISIVENTIDRYFDVIGAINPNVYIALACVRKRMGDIIYASTFVQHRGYASLSDHLADVERGALEDVTNRYFPQQRDEIYAAFRKLSETERGTIQIR